MTIELFRNDSYLKDHNTIISEIVPEGLVLNETIFYPEGGGQPGSPLFFPSSEAVLLAKWFNIPPIKIGRVSSTGR